MIKTVSKGCCTAGCTIIWAGMVVDAIDIISKFCDKALKCYKERQH